MTVSSARSAAAFRMSTSVGEHPDLCAAGGGACGCCQGLRNIPVPSPANPPALMETLHEAPTSTYQTPPLTGDPPAGDLKEEASLPKDLRSTWAPRDVVSKPVRQAAVPHLHCPPRVGIELSPRPPAASQGFLCPGTQQRTRRADLAS